MIFSIPRSKSHIQQYSYQKTKQLNEAKSYLLNRNSSFQFNTGSFVMKKQTPSDLFFQFKQKDSKITSKEKRIKTKKFIYNDKKSRSYDKYFLENKMIPYKAHKSIKINQNSLPLSQKSQEKLNISYGKKLVDPIHQKFNYFIKNTKQQTSPFAISDFLQLYFYARLQPCKIKAKKLQLRPFTSQNNFIPIHSQNLTKRQQIQSRTKTHSSFQKKGYNSSRTTIKNKSHKKDDKIFMEFSKQLCNNKNLKDKSKQFYVEPWQFDPLSQNMESIKIN